MLKTFGYIVELLLMFMSVFSCMLRENTDRRPVTHLIEGTVLHYDGIFSIFRMCYDGSRYEIGFRARGRAEWVFGIGGAFL